MEYTVGFLPAVSRKWLGLVKFVLLKRVRCIYMSQNLL